MGATWRERHREGAQVSRWVCLLRYIVFHPQQGLVVLLRIKFRHIQSNKPT
jgi:hypothetical protein